MLFISRYGTTAENNRWLYPKGIITQDTEAGALRLHDALTPGGWVLPGTPAELPIPGPQTLQAGDTSAGFYGEVPVGDLIDGEALASLAGFSSGSLFNTEAGWLKFAYNEKTLFVAQKNFRYDVSWNHMNNANLIYGSTTVSIGAHQYAVRLLTGGNGDPSTGPGGEWNGLLYPVASGGSSAWASFSDSYLGFDSTSGAARGSWCQETSAADAANAVCRALNGDGVTSYTDNLQKYQTSGIGWRPVLELIQ